MSFVVVIPARYGSTRLPAKPLREIAGKPLVQHVYECAKRSQADRIIIATDDDRIRAVAEKFGAEVCMTKASHATGSDRLAEVIAMENIADDTVVVNLQGDEPLMPSAVIDQVAANLSARPQAVVATVCMRVLTAKELFDPHVVKVVMNRDGYALYFSRAPIPWDRDRFPLTGDLPSDVSFFRHIGLYAYRARFLTQFVNWPVCAIEKNESLEQLRVLWHGDAIHVAEAVERPGPGVDTEEDLYHVGGLLTQGLESSLVFEK